MKTTTITRGGQISVPAEVRHRWKTNRVVIEDHGHELTIRPIPPDPIRAAIGSLRPSAPGDPTSDELRAALREEEAEAEDGSEGRPG